MVRYLAVIFDRHLAPLALSSPPLMSQVCHGPHGQTSDTIGLHRFMAKSIVNEHGLSTRDDCG